MTRVVSTVRPFDFDKITNRIIFIIIFSTRIFFIRTTSTYAILTLTILFRSIICRNRNNLKSFKTLKLFWCIIMRFSIAEPAIYFTITYYFNHRCCTEVSTSPKLPNKLKSNTTICNRISLRVFCDIKI